ncbi:NAD(P)-binding protein [Cryphonectria parasitica EP155]|uniref:Very-long-chain 3-oxoacyl-CoA reductase n=1 Tax=Cryphonectria parasitica (strain ATCC 38755 / EP155) TaxID=660469 RepID=A0A9P5CRG6_CRYP1|nr:NAD(P)-binding protein [Cryphonectria parasitica EP155]KAF3767256.1 NAD(P)-binding protein [Cryphonectria parasitica EP155]
MAGIVEITSSIPQPVQWALAGVGAFVLASRVLSYIWLLLELFVLSGTNLRKYGPKGSWAVVTGASDGLGKEYAKQLASKGFNIVLVSRTQSKLDALASELSGVQTKVLAMDYSQDNEADYARLAELVEGLDVAILINNVGQSHSIPTRFLETEKKELQDIVTINCLGTLKTTQVIAPGMVQRKRGLILTMGSFSGWMPIPYLATYSGSKAFLQHWSTALAGELKEDNVDVYIVLSWLVCSAMSKVRRPSLNVPNPGPFVKNTLGKIGKGRTQNIAYTYTPWWTHALVLWWVENTIGFGSKIGIYFNLVSHKDIRARALRKAAREAKKA